MGKGVFKGCSIVAASFGEHFAKSGKAIVMLVEMFTYLEQLCWCSEWVFTSSSSQILILLNHSHNHCIRIVQICLAYSLCCSTVAYTRDEINEGRELWAGHFMQNYFLKCMFVIVYVLSF